MDHDGKVLSATCELINGVAEAQGEEFSEMFNTHIREPLVKRAKPSSPMDDRIAVSGALADLIKYMPITMNNFTEQLLQLCQLYLNAKNKDLSRNTAYVLGLIAEKCPNAVPH